MLLLSPAVRSNRRPSRCSAATPRLHAQPAQLIPPAARNQPELRFVIVLDPAHGGTDNGAMLAVNSPEKNYTLALAVRIHVLLNAREFHSILTRDADTTVDEYLLALRRPISSHAAACILLHATSTGNGVHLFTSSLAAAGKKISAESSPYISAVANGAGQLRNRKPAAGIGHQCGAGRPACSRSARSHFSDAARQHGLPCGRGRNCSAGREHTACGSGLSAKNCAGPGSGADSMAQRLEIAAVTPRYQKVILWMSAGQLRPDGRISDPHARPCPGSAGRNAECRADACAGRNPAGRQPPS